jgi:hypothetical protein
VGSFSDKGPDLHASVPSLESQNSYPDFSFSWISLVLLKAFSIAAYQFTVHNYPNLYSIINPFNNTVKQSDITKAKSPKEISTMEMT